MARKIHERFLITGTLTTLTPLHVGGYGESADTDLPLARNGDHAFYIPGTSLTGVLRAWCDRAFSNQQVQALWGFQCQPRDRQSPSNDGDGHASLITIDDAPVELPNDAEVEIRDGVGIDRVWGAAAEGIKYDRAVLPRGTRIPLTMTVEIEQRFRQTQAILGHLITALEKNHIAFGAARTRGLGRVQFTLSTLKRQTLDTRDGILDVLRRNGAPITVQELVNADPETNPTPQPRLEVIIQWQPQGPLMVKAGYEGMSVDILPLVSATETGVALVLPGSSTKGALRSQAERIIRTILGQSASRQENPRQRFLDQLDNLPLIQELFGTRAKPSVPHTQREDHITEGSPKPGLGALAVADCYANTSMNAELWRQIVMPKIQIDYVNQQQVLYETLAHVANISEGNVQLTESQHVAIDRWTGGAADGMLYNILAPMHVVWENLQLTVDLQRLPEHLQLPALMLLLLTLRDLMQHRIPLGFATHRGMGDIAVSEVLLNGEGLDSIGLEALEQVSLYDATFQTLECGLRDRLTNAWQQWIAQTSESGGAQ